jgi:nicotinate-nucleotide adenylyltransferase
MNITDVKQLIKQNETAKALEILNDHLASVPFDLDALLFRGHIHYKMQNWGEAMNDYSAVLELDSNNQEAKTGLEMAKNILGYFTPDMFNP